MDRRQPNHGNKSRSDGMSCPRSASRDDCSNAAESAKEVAMTTWLFVLVPLAVLLV